MLENTDKSISSILDGLDISNNVPELAKSAVEHYGTEACINQWVFIPLGIFLVIIGLILLLTAIAHDDSEVKFIAIIGMVATLLFGISSLSSGIKDSVSCNNPQGAVVRKIINNNSCK